MHEGQTHFNAVLYHSMVWSAVHPAWVPISFTNTERRDANIISGNYIILHCVVPQQSLIKAIPALATDGLFGGGSLTADISFGVSAILK